MAHSIRFPDLCEPYAAALRDAVAFVLTRTRPIGIVASGTIIRGSPDVSSDLDIYVIHQQAWRQRIQRRFNGVPAEIFINPPSAIEAYFVEEHADGRPLTAHMLATGVVVLNEDAMVDVLIARARQTLAASPRYDDFGLRMAHYTAATLFEDALDVADRDEATATMLLDKAVSVALEYVFRSRGRFVPRHKDLLRALTDLDPLIGEAARRFYTSATWEERLAKALIIMDGVIGARGFFEWESEPQTTAPA
jgi:hypothetical protein